jgi:hypothetical protein
VTTENLSELGVTPEDYETATRLKIEKRRELVQKLRWPPYSYTLKHIGEVLGVSLVTVFQDIRKLPSSTRLELRATKVVGENGRKYPALKRSRRVRAKRKKAT